MKSHPLTLILVLAGWVAIVAGAASFATAAEVKAVETKVDIMLELQLSATLRGLQLQWCAANGNKLIIATMIDDHQRRYRELTGARYPLPKCEVT